MFSRWLRRRARAPAAAIARRTAGSRRSRWPWAPILAKKLFERGAYARQPTSVEPIRKALVQALDLNNLGKIATNGTGKPPSGLVARGQGPCPSESVFGALPPTDVTPKPATQTQLDRDVLAGQSAWSAALMPFTSTLPHGTNFANLQNSGYTEGVRSASAKAGPAGCPDWAGAEKALYAKVNLVPYVDSPLPYSGNGATFELSQGLISPSSIRMPG